MLVVVCVQKMFVCKKNAIFLFLNRPGGDLKKGFLNRPGGDLKKGGQLQLHADACSRMLTYDHVCSRVLTCAHVC